MVGRRWSGASSALTAVQPDSEADSTNQAIAGHPNASSRIFMDDYHSVRKTVDRSDEALVVHDPRGIDVRRRQRANGRLVVLDDQVDLLKITDARGTAGGLKTRSRSTQAGPGSR